MPSSRVWRREARTAVGLNDPRVNRPSDRAHRTGGPRPRSDPAGGRGDQRRAQSDFRRSPRPRDRRPEIHTTAIQRRLSSSESRSVASTSSDTRRCTFSNPADRARQTLHFGAEEREWARRASACQYLMRTLSITTFAELRRGRRQSSNRLGRDQALAPQLRPRSGAERRPGAAAPSIARGIDAAAADAGRCYLYTSAAFLCTDGKPAESADRNRFSTELSANFGDNGDQYLV
jgi:hypothetical protein